MARKRVGLLLIVIGLLLLSHSIFVACQKIHRLGSAATDMIVTQPDSLEILSELDMDARQPISAIAKKVGLSKEVVNYRIKQLEKKKVIREYYTVLNITKLGLIFCRLFMRL